MLAAGIEPESGLPHRIDDSDLLLWVHCTEVASFVSTYRRCGGRLRTGDADRYVEEMRAWAELIGPDPARRPRAMAQIDASYERVLPDLRRGRPSCCSPSPCCPAGPAVSTACPRPRQLVGEPGAPIGQDPPSA